LDRGIAIEAALGIDDAAIERIADLDLILFAQGFRLGRLVPVVAAWVIRLVGSSPAPEQPLSSPPAAKARELVSMRRRPMTKGASMRGRLVSAVMGLSYFSWRMIMKFSGRAAARCSSAICSR
jgi:hypothetical protein